MKAYPNPCFFWNLLTVTYVLHLPHNLWHIIQQHHLATEAPLTCHIVPPFHNFQGFSLLQGPGSVVGVATVATGWKVRVSNPGRGKIFRTCPDQSWGPSSLLYNAYRVFPRGKERQGREADPSTLSSAVVKKE
jgi:hypothetical protein